MSHPSPQHDAGNEYPEDNVSHYPHKKTGQKSRKPHTIGTRMQHINAKTRALKEKMEGLGGRFTKR